jgi:hypothetical protein
MAMAAPMPTNTGARPPPQRPHALRGPNRGAPPAPPRGAPLSRSGLGPNSLPIPGMDNCHIVYNVVVCSEFHHP